MQFFLHPPPLIRPTTKHPFSVDEANCPRPAKKRRNDPIRYAADGVWT